MTSGTSRRQKRYGTGDTKTALRSAVSVDGGITAAATFTRYGPRKTITARGRGDDMIYSKGINIKEILRPGTLPPGKPTNDMVVALERARARLCLECELNKCINCYESKKITVRRQMFQKALSMKIPEDIARKMFMRGDLL